MSIVMYSRNGEWLFAITKRIDIWTILFQYTHSVGVGIAYPQQTGNARASDSGMSNDFQIPALFLCGFTQVTVSPELGVAGKKV